MRKTLVLLVLLAGLVGLAACTALVEVSPAPVSTTPLVEYSIDGETWHGLTRGEVKNLPVSVVQIRKTDQGAEHNFSIIEDLASIFIGSVVKDETTNIIEAGGKGALMLVIDNRDYAKIVLVPE